MPIAALFLYIAARNARIRRQASRRIAGSFVLSKIAALQSISINSRDSMLGESIAPHRQWRVQLNTREIGMASIARRACSSDEARRAASADGASVLHDVSGALLLHQLREMRMKRGVRRIIEASDAY